jgi:hypothetical protein
LIFFVKNREEKFTICAKFFAVFFLFFACLEVWELSDLFYLPNLTLFSLLLTLDLTDRTSSQIPLCRPNKKIIFSLKFFKFQLLMCNMFYWIWKSRKTVTRSTFRIQWMLFISIVIQVRVVYQNFGIGQMGSGRCVSDFDYCLGLGGTCK